MMLCSSLLPLFHLVVVVRVVYELIRHQHQHQHEHQHRIGITTVSVKPPIAVGFRGGRKETPLTAVQHSVGLLLLRP